MAEKILFGDDDANLLPSPQRQLRNQFTTDTAADGNQGLDAIQGQGPYSIVVSDFEVRWVTALKLTENMILAEDVCGANGMLLISKGHEISLPLIQRLKNLASISGVKEPIKVLVNKGSR
jgi:CheY-like chemotaxis protein